ASPNPGSMFNNLMAVSTVSTNDVWAVGSYRNSGGPDQTLVEHWNGTQWTVVPSPNSEPSYNYLFGVAVVAANDVWAVGTYNGYGGRTLILHWDGAQWS